MDGSTRPSLAERRQQALEENIWDLRHFVEDVPRHISEGSLRIDFTRVKNSDLRQQLQRYLLHRMGFPHNNGASALKREAAYLFLFADLIPDDIHIGTLTRTHIQSMLDALAQRGRKSNYAIISSICGFLEWAISTLDWTWDRPTPDLLHRDAVRRPAPTPARPIPLDAYQDFSSLKREAIAAMEEGQTPPIIDGTHWDILIILDETGLRTTDALHLIAPDAGGQQGCLRKIREDRTELLYLNRKTKKYCAIPISPTAVGAIQRQCDRANHLPEIYGHRYLFRSGEGIIQGVQVRQALRSLAPHLHHQGEPYIIAPHQFRHTQATRMAMAATDPGFIQYYLGHTRVETTEGYIASLDPHIRTQFETYRERSSQAAEQRRLAAVIDADSNSQIIYLPLPGGLGYCRVLPSETVHCSQCNTMFCARLVAYREHTAAWERVRASHCQLIDLLSDRAQADQTRQNFEHELAQVHRIIDALHLHGVWNGEA
jgi:integrase